jgi:hypothetical protein
MTTEVANPEIPIGNMEPELGLGDITQSEEFVNIGPEPEFGEMTSRNGRSSIMMKERAINKPTPFDGDRKKTETFLQECRVYLHINRGVYTTDEDRIIFILSFMNSKEALRWKQTYLRSILTRDGNMIFPDINTFIGLLENYFQPANLGQDAAHQLNLLKQGKKTAEEVLTEFRLLSSQAGYVAETATDHLHLIERVQRVLNASLIRKIRLMESPPTTIEGWIEKAIFFDNMYRNTMEVLEQKAKEERTIPRNTGKANSMKRFDYSNYFGNRNTQANRTTRERKDPDAMDIDAMSTEKRVALMKKGLCFICEKPGHLAKEHKDRNFGVEKKEETKTPKRKDLRKLHTYLQALTREEKEELFALQNPGDKEEKEEDSDSDF